MKPLLFFFLISIIYLYCGNTKNQTKFVLLSQRSDIQLEIDPQLGTPNLIKGTLASLQSFRNNDTAESAIKIIELNQDLFKLKSPGLELVLENTDSDDLGFQHLTFTRQVGNIKIWGDELKMHFNKEGILYYVNGHYHATLPEDFSTGSRLSQAEAEDIALSDARKNITANKVKTTQLIIFPKDLIFYLSYRINVVEGAFDAINWDYFVDAMDGRILHKYNNIRKSN